jgi:large subunit ribosomal protein L10
MFLWCTALQSAKNCHKQRKQKPNQEAQMATKARKQEIVAELESLLNKSQVAIVADLSGYTVAEITAFRRTLDKDNAQCRIAKNTLIEIASSKGQFEPLKNLTKGPTALIVGLEDPAAPAKTTVQYIKKIKKGTIRGGVLENKLLDSKDVTDLAELPSKEALLSSIMGGLDSGARGIAGILNNVISDIASIIEEIAKKKEGVEEQ